MPKQLRPEKVNEILDKAAEGGSLQKIADATGVATKTVLNLMSDFPLWGYFREKDKKDKRGYGRF